MAEIIDISKAKETQTETKPPIEPKTRTEIIASIENYTTKIYESCEKAFSELPESLEQELWDQEQMGIYRYAVDQLQAAEILENFRKKLETK